MFTDSDQFPVEQICDPVYEVIVSDMTSFYVKRQIYELTLYFDAWSKEIVGYGLGMHKGDKQSYYDGLKQVLEKIKEQPDNLITLHTDQGSVYSSKAYNDLLTDFNIQRSMSRAGVTINLCKLVESVRLS